MNITNAEAQAATGKTVDQIKADVKTNTTSDKVDANSGKLENTFDKNKVQKELALQVAVTQEFDKNSQEVRTLINAKEKEKRDKADELDKVAIAVEKLTSGETLTDEEKAEYLKRLNGLDKDFLDRIDKGQITNEEKEGLRAQASNLRTQAGGLRDEAKKWENGGVLFDSITGTLSAPNSNGLTGTMAKTASPFVAKEIGDYFKNKDAQGSAGHLIAHAVLGAAVAVATGNSALAGGVSAAGAEKVAPILSKWLYGESDPSKLTAEQKSSISAILGLAGNAIGSAIGGDAGAITGGQAAQTAFDDNRSLFFKSLFARRKKIAPHTPVKPLLTERMLVTKWRVKIGKK